MVTMVKQSLTVYYTSPPTITAPLPNQRWSNAVFNVTGTISNSVNVLAVAYQLNGAGWHAATTTNNWSNWAAQVDLKPGTNTIQACAIDNSGNLTPTNQVKFVYVPIAMLTLETNGIGTISPNYRGVSLLVGNSYKMTATAAKGFSFAGWTGSSATNGATLKFVMASNLTFTANFLDNTEPTLTIMTPTAGQRWSNAVFTVKGTAADNWQVASIQYQVNGGDWTNATGTTNWMASVNLVPGTNTIQAYAVDISGNHSVTKGVNLDFVVTNQLIISATGLGTISPNYSNAWLELGRNYSIKTTHASGFICTNWVISTNWLGGVTTNNSTVQFRMETNLTLQVNFADVTTPKLTIKTPTAGQHMSNALASITGTATDNWKVASVWYQLNGGAWNQATTANGWTNWLATVELQNATNVIKVYAVDLGGNFSPNVSVSFVSSNAFKLQLAFAMAQPLVTNGLNFNLQISPGLNGHIQVSTNLVDWMTLTNFVGTNANINFLDTSATNFNQRFYRAVIP